MTDALLRSSTLPQVRVREDQVYPRPFPRLGMDAGNAPQLQPEGLDQPAADTAACAVGRKAQAVIGNAQFQFAAWRGRHGDADHALSLAGESMLEDVGQGLDREQSQRHRHAARYP